MNQIQARYRELEDNQTCVLSLKYLQSCRG